ncbi:MULTISPECIES: hypothetical protein [unclassified Polaromonas]|nr:MULTISPECIES: hypothetical protein [unclassified Polaromonas]MBG6071812.1 hypothetical protein [Polaromonas sp. CG_9.7]MBG6113813.1 hypothetical protein [Polaromonas sp. CG_9.2]MDH6183730.1 hypothetical protein [Polaromonas sp. CG_23.6]
MNRPLTRVPAALQAKFNAIAQATDVFSNQHLKHECRKRICLAKDGA